MGGLLSAGCGQNGSITDTIPAVQDRDLSAIVGPTDASKLRPVERCPRAVRRGRPVALTLDDTPFFVYPSLDESERQSLREGLTFVTARAHRGRGARSGE